MKRLGFCLVLAVPFWARAQSDSTRGEVRGIVYDSVARAPIKGAWVQLALSASPSERAYSATTNERGEYAIAGIVPGRYVAGFQAEALDTLALNTPLRVVDVAAGVHTRLDLGVPSSATIVERICRTHESDPSGLVIGMLRDARTGDPLDTGNVIARWSELIIEKGGFSNFEDNAQAIVNKQGWFALCYVPAMEDLAVSGFHASDSTGLVFLTMPNRGVVRRDLFVGGRMTLRGWVLSERNAPIFNARIGFIGFDRTVVTDSGGTFIMRDAPAGSTTMEVRALGFAPSQKAMLLAAGADTSVPVSLTSLRKVMDTIHIVSTRIFGRDSRGFEQRKRSGMGYYYDRQWIAQHRPFDLIQLLQRVPSIYVTRVGMERRVLMRGGMGRCVPAFFLNGARMPMEVVGDIDLLATPDEVVGLEVYRNTTVPAQFASLNTNCGAIVLWTQPPLKK